LIRRKQEVLGCLTAEQQRSDVDRESRGGVMTMAERQKKVALVIGSGSVKCAAAIGLHQALVQEGIEVEMVVGCSGGALYAAFIALGHTPEESQALSMRLWTREVTARRNPRAFRQIL
jgi:NTE family protein